MGSTEPTETLDPINDGPVFLCHTNGALRSRLKLDPLRTDHDRYVVRVSHQWGSAEPTETWMLFNNSYEIIVAGHTNGLYGAD